MLNFVGVIGVTHIQTQKPAGGTSLVSGLILGQLISEK